MEILQQIILGIIQGVLEWLPVSSEGFLIYLSNNFFNNFSLESFVRIALFLHLGTFFAALIYFRKDVKILTKKLINYKNADETSKKIINFLIISTLISGLLGLLILQAIKIIDTEFFLRGKTINFLLGSLLLFTGTLQIFSKNNFIRIRSFHNLRFIDSIFLGLMQGLAVLPGLSRSGLTMSTLLLRRFDDRVALKLSFLMSLPIVLLGNIFLNFKDIVFFNEILLGLFFSFIFGIITIYGLMKLAEKIQFGYFVIFIALLMLVSLLF